MTVCFDLDGTLLYTLEDLHNALNQSLKKYGYKEVSLDETRLNVGNGIKNLIIDSAKSSDNIDLMFSEFKKYYVNRNDTSRTTTWCTFYSNMHKHMKWDWDSTQGTTILYFNTHNIHYVCYFNSYSIIKPQAFLYK